MAEPERIRVPERFGDEDIEVIYRRSPPLDAPKESPIHGVGFYPPLNQRTYVEDGIRVDQDVAVKLRDGTILYLDLYRPDGPSGVADLPAIVAWGFYGKRAFEDPDKDWDVFGVVPGTVNKNMTKFEGPDPAFWCRHGYAVVNVDSRGAGNSQGNLCVWGEQDGRDGADVIEWLASQVWSNGKVGMLGNSALAMSQWYIAAEQPPHLTCIAPWEGTADLYREFATDNGIPGPGFNNFVMGIARSCGYIEDYMKMLEEHPLIDAYWKSKIPKFAKITIPTYMTGGWSHIHLRGALNAFRGISSTEKWLRVHRDFEWPDLYDRWNQEDIRQFFDRYLKGIRNGWNMTPRVRLDVMDAYDYDYQVHRPETDFPLERTQYKKLYLDASSGSLSAQLPPKEAKASYDANEGMALFDVRFDETTEITGYMKVRLWVEADGHDEMDLFLNVLKLDDKGEWLPTNVLGEPHPGAWARLRVSQRQLDRDLSTDFQPVQSHGASEKLRPGEIVPVEIAFYPHSKIWHPGQQLRLRVCGHYVREGWFEPFSWATDNKGKHIIHTGGQYDSYLQIPVIPPKYQAGNYVCR